MCSIGWAHAAAFCNDRLLPWLLGDFVKDETRALEYDATAVKRMKSALRSGLRSTGRALRENWYRNLPNRFRSILQCKAASVRSRGEVTGSFSLGRLCRDPMALSKHIGTLTACNGKSGRARLSEANRGVRGANPRLRLRIPRRASIRLRDLHILLAVVPTCERQGNRARSTLNAERQLRSRES